MSEPNLDRLTASEVAADANLFLGLVAEGEQLYVERKEIYPRGALEGFGAEIASMANTLGGWVLLGVRDGSGDLVAPGLPDGDAQSIIGNDLRKVLDPVPPFVARRIEVDGVEVAFVRVLESSAKPVVVSGGRIYGRDAGGKRPIESHRDLLELAAQGRKAEEAARRRIEENQLSADVLGLPHERHSQIENHMRTIVRMAPLTVTAQLQEWPIGKGPSVCQEAANRLAAAVGPSDSVGYATQLEPHNRGVAGRADPLTPFADSFGLWRASTVADCVGVFGASFFRPLVNLNPSHQLRRDHIRPAIDAVASMLHEAEAFGDAICELQLVHDREAFLDGPGRTLKDHKLPSRIRCGSARLTIPADDEGRADLGRRWEREVARTVRIPLWEVADEV